MIITNAQYHKHPEKGNTSITVTIDGEVVSVPLDPNNRHYAEILRQVEEKKLTIKEADE